MLGVVRRNPGFRRIWLSQVVSQGGDWFSRVAVLALILDGKKFPRLRQTNTLSALQSFVTLGLVDQGMAEELHDSYLFLRNLECALRIIRQTPTNTLPKDKKELAPLARLLGYEGEDAETLADSLLTDYDFHTQRVRKHYRKTIGNLLRAH